MSASQKIAHRLVLKDTHPTAIKIAKLCDLANELGISLSFYHQRVLVDDNDRDKNLPPLYLEDIEENHWVESFPFEMEYKLVYENPAYVAQQKQEQEERERAEYLALKISREKEEQKAKAEAEERAKALEARERRLLSELKDKYES